MSVIDNDRPVSAYTEPVIDYSERKEQVRQAVRRYRDGDTASTAARLTSLTRNSMRFKSVVISIRTGVAIAPTKPKRSLAPNFRCRPSGRNVPSRVIVGVRLYEIGP
jgi:hypothetical protein